MVTGGTAGTGGTMEPLPWTRSQTTGGEVGEKSNSSDSLSIPPQRRGVTAGPTVDRGVTDTAMGSYEEVIDSLAKQRKAQSIAMNMALCTVNLMVGCLMPAIADRSRTANVKGLSDGVVHQYGRRFPYHPAHLLMAEALANVVIGVIAIKFRVKKPLEKVFDFWHNPDHSRMLPLTLIYCIGDLAALGAIGSGGSLLYLTVSNSRILFAACASTLIMGQRLECFQWILLAVIQSCIVIFAADLESGSEEATIGLLLALLKSFLSALAAVMTERRYKKMNIWEANTLLKMQSFFVALLLTNLNSPMVRCPDTLEEFEKLGKDVKCIDHDGWDCWTYFVLVAEVCNGWLSVAILTRLSAIAKFVCKAACAPSLYVAYCLLGWNHFKGKRFGSVLFMAISIILYAKEPLEVVWGYVRLRRHPWVSNYSKPAKACAPCKSGGVASETP